MADTVDVRVGSDLIKPIIEAKIHAAIMESMKDGAVADAAIHALLHGKVDDRGKYTKSSYGTNLIEWLATSAIKDAARTAMEEHFAESKPKLVEMVKKALARKSNSLANILVSGLEDSIKTEWSSTITVKLENLKD